MIVSREVFEPARAALYGRDAEEIGLLMRTFYMGM
jgi:hypothetical protein